MVYNANDTIAAISTPPGSGGIGVVRLSGPDSLNIARKIFRSTSGATSEKQEGSSVSEPIVITPRRMHHGNIIVQGQKDVLDEVLMVSMPAPNSYTREDVVEIQAHAGAIVLKKILDSVLDLGARLAEPGEFTRRAYLNGRLDLSQAEAVIDVIQAKTEASLRIASRQLEGNVGRMANYIRECILAAQAILEAEIEFPEDLQDTDDNKETCRSAIEEALSILDDILEGYNKGHLIRDGLRLTIIGKVNVGKSSLLNRFLRKERAIVTDFPGTTRDHIEETIDIFGLPVILVDTAGWRDTTDPVEKIGIDRTRDLAEAADLILFMVDAERGISAEDQDLYRRVKNKEKILVINKTDLLKDGDQFALPSEMEVFDTIYTSVKFDQGIDALKNRIHRFGTVGWTGKESAIVPTLRQKKLFEKAQRAIYAARDGSEGIYNPELTVIDLQEAMDALDEITGASVKSDVLDAVFSRFCIGK